MATLGNFSPATLHRQASPPAAAGRISSSLRLLPSALRIRRRPLSSGGRGAAGATMFGTAASSYASALSDVAKSSDTLESTLTDLEKVSRVFSAPSVPAFFANPTVPVQMKKEFIAELAKSSELHPHTANFLNIVVDMRRIDLLDEIVKEYEMAYNKITGTEVAVVTSVVKLESQHLAQIAKTVQQLTDAKNVRIKTEIDPSLIAGFTIRYGSSGSKLIDMSVRKQLDEIASQLDFSSIALA